MNDTTRDREVLYPWSEDLEVAVLGSAFYGDGKADRVASLSDDLFYASAHQEVLLAVRALRSAGRSVDLMVLYEHFERLGRLEQVGGYEALSRMGDVATSALNADDYIERLARLCQIRKLTELDAEKRRRILDGDDPEVVLGWLEQQVIEIRDVGGRIADDFVDFGEAAEEVYRTAKALHDGDEDAQALALTGLPTVDKDRGGVFGGEFIVLGAETGHGKTAFALGLAIRNARRGVGSLIFSAEMKPEENARRYIAGQSGIPEGRLRSGRLRDVDWEPFFSAITESEGLPIHFFDGPVTLASIRSKAAYAKSRFGIRLIIVDYIQLVRVAARFDSREQVVNHIGRSLKNLAADLDVTIIGLSQLNDDPTKRKGRKPMMGDTRESKALEHHANAVWFVWRKKKDTPEEEVFLRRPKDRVGGSKPDLPLAWHARDATYVELDEDDQW